jgi:hypothetical protein
VNNLFAIDIASSDKLMDQIEESASVGSTASETLFTGKLENGQNMAGMLLTSETNMTVYEVFGL